MLLLERRINLSRKLATALGFPLTAIARIYQEYVNSRRRQRHVILAVHRWCKEEDSLCDWQRKKKIASGYTSVQRSYDSSYQWTHFTAYTAFHNDLQSLTNKRTIIDLAELLTTLLMDQRTSSLNRGEQRSCIQRSYDFSSFRQTIESVWLLVVSIMMWDVSCCRLLMKFVPILTCVTYPGIFLYITCTPLHLPSLPVMMVSSRRSMQSSIVRGKHESSLRNTLSDSDTLFAPVLVRFRSVEHVGYIYFHSKQGRKATKTQGATKYKRISKRKNIINEREQ